MCALLAGIEGEEQLPLGDGRTRQKTDFGDAPRQLVAQLRRLGRDYDTADGETGLLFDGLRGYGHHSFHGLRKRLGHRDCCLDLLVLVPAEPDSDGETGKDDDEPAAESQDRQLPRLNALENGIGLSLGRV